MFQYYTRCTTGPTNPFHGAISFDNIGLAWVAIFLVISLEGWTDVMYFVQDAHSFWNWIYFVCLIVVCRPCYNTINTKCSLRGVNQNLTQRDIGILKIKILGSVQILYDSLAWTKRFSLDLVLKHCLILFPLSPLL